MAGVVAHTDGGVDAGIGVGIDTSVLSSRRARMRRARWSGLCGSGSKPRT